MNSNQYEISFSLKIWLPCLVSSLLMFTLIEAKWNSNRYGFHFGHFDQNEISFQFIKYHLNTTQNEMPTHVHQSVGLFWNAAEMKCHMNRTCFHVGLKSQTGMSLFCLCERIVRFVLLSGIDIMFDNNSIEYS